jgi:hypothetical protein
MKYFIKNLILLIYEAIIMKMKVGQLVDKINIRLREDNPDLSPENILKPSNVNGYKSQGFIHPAPQKAAGKAFFEYTHIHEELIYRAYTKILQGIRTQVAFKRAADELHSLF